MESKFYISKTVESNRMERPMRESGIEVAMNWAILSIRA